MSDRSVDTGILAGLALAFAVAVLYRGAGDNLPFLAYSMLPLLVAVALRYGARGGSTLYWSWLHTGALLYIGYMAASVFWSTLPENSFFTFWVLAALPLAFLVVVQLDDRHWRTLLVLLLVSGALSALWGLVEFVLTKRRASGPLIDPNAWAAMLNLLFFALLTFYTQVRGARRWQARLCEFALFVLAAAFFSAYSRAATVVFVAVFAFVAGWSAWFARDALRRIVIAAGIALVAFSLVHGYASQSEASHREGYTLNVEDKAWSQRFVQWQAAWRIYREHPWTGSGLGTFKVQYPRYREAGDLRTLGNYVHNDYLQLLQEGGPVQLLGVLAIIATLLVVLVRTAQSAGSREGRANTMEVGGLVGAMGTAYLHSLLTFTQYQLPVSLLLGICLGRLVHLSPRDGIFPRVELPPTLPWPGLLLFLLFPWSLLMMDCVSYALVYGQRWVPFAERIARDPLQFHDTLRVLATLRPGVSLNHLALATVYRKVMDRQDDPESRLALGVTVAAEYRRTLDANPYQYMVYVYYADLLDEQPRVARAPGVRDESIALLERAISVAPVYLEPYVALAERLAAKGERHRAYTLLKDRALPWIDLEYWNYERARLRFVYTLLTLAREEEDTALTVYLEGRLAELQPEAITPS